MFAVPPELVLMFENEFSSQVPCDPKQTPCQFHLEFPSRCLPGCNTGFESFVMRFGTTRERSILSHAHITATDRHRLITKYSIMFFIRIISLCRPKYTVWQRFYVHLFMNFTGTNSRGIDFLFCGGLTTSQSTFSRYKHFLVGRIKQELHGLMGNNYPKVFFLDNYNISYYLGTQSVSGNQVCTYRYHSHIF